MLSIDSYSRHIIVLYLLFSAGIFVPSSAFGQEITDNKPVCEVALSTSYTAYMIGGVGGGFTGIPFMADFRIAAGRWVAFGVTGGFHLGSSKSFWKQFNIMANLYGTWYNSEKFRVYSDIGYGNAAGMVTGDGMPAMGFQFTPVGLSFGRKFFGFTEIGAGWMYFPVRLGVGWRF